MVADKERHPFSKSLDLPLYVNSFMFEDFTLKHLLLFEISSPEICEKFIYKHSETIEYVEN